MSAAPESQPDAAQRIDDFRERFHAIEEEVGKVIVGHRDVVDGALTCITTP